MVAPKCEGSLERDKTALNECVKTPESYNLSYKIMKSGLAPNVKGLVVRRHKPVRLTGRFFIHQLISKRLAPGGEMGLRHVWKWTKRCCIESFRAGKYFYMRHMALIINQNS